MKYEMLKTFYSKIYNNYNHNHRIVIMQALLFKSPA